jgi:hypothetical protein
MHRIHRAIIVMPVLAFLIAACAAPETGGQASDAATSPSTAASADATSDASAPASPTDDAEAGPTRVDLSALAADPSAFTGGELRILARVDEVTEEDASFLTSPSASEEGQILVVLADDAELSKTLEVGSVVWVDGTLVGATSEELESAGAAATELPDGYAGEYAMVASAVTDPLGGDEAE